jgi:DNA-binding GntR family transcriptional regulator
LGKAAKTETFPREDETGTARFDRIYGDLRDRICLLDYPPGTVLSEVALAREFEVSRTPIRRVFHQLEFMGLVQIRNGIGTIVTDIDLKTFKETYDLRKRLAEMMGELSPVEITAKHLTQIDQLIARAKKIETQRGNYGDLALIANETQRLLSDLTGNTPLREIIELLYYRVARIWFTLLPQFGWDEAISGQLNELQEIRSGMAANDIRAVGQFRRKDLQRMMNLLGRSLVGS